MPTYVTIGYGDAEGYERTPRAVREAAHAHDAALVRGGAVTGIAGRPVQVRNTADRAVTTAEGPFMTAALPVAGFALIEADSLEQAIEMVSGTPCAVAHGVVEVWPLQSAPD